MHVRNYSRRFVCAHTSFALLFNVKSLPGDRYANTFYQSLGFYPMLMLQLIASRWCACCASACALNCAV